MTANEAEFEEVIAPDLRALVYVSRLSKAESTQAYRLDGAFQSLGIGACLRQAVPNVVLDRLIRSEGCLGTARKLAGHDGGRIPDEEDLRTAVNRAYYAAHHALRAMILHKHKWEEDGHASTITKLKELAEKDEDFRSRTKLDATIVRRLAEARDNREVADYSPYPLSVATGAERGWVTITEGDWTKASDFNIQVATDLLSAAHRYVDVNPPEGK